MSASARSTASPSTLRGSAPGWRTATTDAPLSSSSLVSAEPMKPPAPVTTTRSAGSIGNALLRWALRRPAQLQEAGRARRSDALTLQGALGEGLAELEDESRVAMGVGQHVVEGGSRSSRPPPRRPMSGGSSLIDIDVVGRHLREYPVAAEQRADDELGEQTRPCRLEHLPTSRSRSESGSPKTSPTIRPCRGPREASRSVDERSERPFQRLSHVVGPLHDSLVVNRLQAWRVRRPSPAGCA